MCEQVYGPVNSGAQRNQKRMSDALELELREVISSYEGDGNCWAISPALCEP
jgi:hypothetical protein